jgi:hypothetical protein
LDGIKLVPIIDNLHLRLARIDAGGVEIVKRITAFSNSRNLAISWRFRSGDSLSAFSFLDSCFVLIWSHACFCILHRSSERTICQNFQHAPAVAAFTAPHEDRAAAHLFGALNNLLRYNRAARAGRDRCIPHCVCNTFVAALDFVGWHPLSPYFTERSLFCSTIVWCIVHRSMHSAVLLPYPFLPFPALQGHSMSVERPRIPSIVSPMIGNGLLDMESVLVIHAPPGVASPV